MIIALNRLPCGGDMASLARAPQLAAMRVLAGVTTGAVAGQSAIVIPRAMTGRAGYALMGAGEGIVAQRVVEIGPIQTDQRIAASFMVTMTGFARAGTRCRKLAMITLLARNIGPHPFVTGHAFSILRGFFK